MLHKRMLLLFLVLCILLGSTYAAAFSVECGFSGEAALSAFGGAESVVGGLRADMAVTASKSGLHIGIVGSATLNHSLLDYTRFATIPAGYAVEVGLLAGVHSKNDGFALSVASSAREVYFMEQDRWYLQVGGRVNGSVMLAQFIALKSSVGYFWNQGFISMPVTLGVGVAL